MIKYFIILLSLVCFSANAEYRVSSNFLFETRPLKDADTRENIGRVSVGRLCGDFVYSTLGGFYKYHMVTNDTGISGAAICEEFEVTNPYLESIPGRVEFENFTLAKDQDSENRGGEYRNDFGVDIENKTGDENGANIGWTDSGEWLEYEINTTETSLFYVTARYARASTPSLVSIAILVDGVQVETLNGVNNLPVTGNWSDWRVYQVGQIFLNRGNHTVRVVINSGHINFDWLEFAPARVTIKVMAIS